MVLKQLEFLVSSLGECGAPERTDFQKFLIFEDVLVLYQLILDNFTLGGCGSLKITDFG